LSYDEAVTPRRSRLHTLSQASFLHVIAAQQAYLPALEAVSLQIQARVQDAYEKHEVTLGGKSEEVKMPPAFPGREAHRLNGLDFRLGAKKCPVSRGQHPQGVQGKRQQDRLDSPHGFRVASKCQPVLVRSN